jgi:hypothetical protein
VPHRRRQLSGMSDDFRTARTCCDCRAIENRSEALRAYPRPTAPARPRNGGSQTSGVSSTPAGSLPLMNEFGVSPGSVIASSSGAPGVIPRSKASNAIF